MSVFYYVCVWVFEVEVEVEVEVEAEVEVEVEGATVSIGLETGATGATGILRNHVVDAESV